MIRTRSLNSTLDVKYDKHNAPQEPIPCVLNPARPVLSASGDSPQSEPFIGGRSADEEHTFSGRQPSTRQSSQSLRCTGNTAARIRQATYEAAERLAAIEMLRLQLEAELVHKKLEADIAILRSYSEGVTDRNYQLEDRLRHGEPAQRELIYDILPARDTRTPLAAAPPVRPVTINTEPKPERYSKDTGAISSTENHSRTELHSQENLPELLRPVRDTLSLIMKKAPRSVTGQNHSQTTRKDSSAITSIFDEQVLTGSRNEPAASRIELCWVIRSTAPRLTTSNKDDHHVFHLRAENKKQPASHKLFDALAQPLRADAESVSPKPMFYATMQKEEAKEETNQLKPVAQLSPYYNTGGVRTFQLPFCNIKGQAYTAKVHVRFKSVELEEIHDLELAMKKSCHSAKLDPTLVHGLLRVRGLGAVIVSYPAKRPILSKCRRLFTRLQLILEGGARFMNNKRTVNDVQQKCWAMSLRARGKKFALKCFPWRARRPKRSIARLLLSNPRKPERTEQFIESCPHYWVYDYRSTLVLIRKPMTIKRQTYKISEVFIMDPAFLHLRKKRNKETRGGVFHRTKKKLAVLTRNMKLRESFAEGSVEDRSIVPHTAPAVTNADWLTADAPSPRDPLTTCDRLISRSTRPYARAGWEN